MFYNQLKDVSRVVPLRREPLFDFSEDQKISTEIFVANMCELKAFPIPGLPGAVYVPNAFADEQNELFQTATQFCQENGTRRLTISGMKGPKVAAKLNRDLPPWILMIHEKIRQVGFFSEAEKVRQVSVNHYIGDTHFMIPHKDGKGEKGCIVTLGSGTTLEFTAQPCDHVIQQTLVFPQTDKPTVEVYLEKGSILLVSSEAYTQWVHGISERNFDEIHNSIANLDCLHARQGEKVARSDRVSIVFWPNQAY